MDYRKMRNITAELLEIINDNLKFGISISDFTLEKFYNVANSFKFNGSYGDDFRNRVSSVVSMLKGKNSSNQSDYSKLIDVALIPKIVAEHLSVSDKIAEYNVSKFFETVNKKR